MKVSKVISTILIGCMLMSLTGCASDTEFGQSYGLANVETKMNPKAKYEISFGSCFVAFIFCETIIVPIYVLGWNLYEAKGLK